LAAVARAAAVCSSGAGQPTPRAAHRLISHSRADDGASFKRIRNYHMSQTLDGAIGAEHSLARIEAMLARYPLTSADETAEMRHWFANEASALDMGLIASNEALTPQYRRFRAEQLDRFGARDIALISAVAVLLGAGLVALMIL
jgi:hypothetical protein